MKLENLARNKRLVNVVFWFSIENQEFSVNLFVYQSNPGLLLSTYPYWSATVCWPLKVRSTVLVLNLWTQQLNASARVLQINIPCNSSNKWNKIEDSVSENKFLLFSTNVWWFYQFVGVYIVSREDTLFLPL